MTNWRRTPAGHLVIHPARFVRFGFQALVEKGQVRAWVQWHGHPAYIRSVMARGGYYVAELTVPGIQRMYDGPNVDGLAWVIMPADEDIGIVIEDARIEIVDALGRVREKQR